MQYYKKIKFEQLDIKKYATTGVRQRVTYKFIEAEEFRKRFEAQAWSQLKMAERFQSNDKNHALAAFHEPCPSQIFLHVLMVDFYKDLPTLSSCIARKIGQKKATSITRRLVEGGAVVEHQQEEDHRVKILFPTIQTVCGYETQMAKVAVVAALNVYAGDNKNEIFQKSEQIKSFIEFDRLRKKFLPEDIFERFNFDLEELLEGTAFASNFQHPYLVKK